MEILPDDIRRTDTTPKTIPCPICKGYGYTVKTIYRTKMGPNGFTSSYRGSDRIVCLTCGRTGVVIQEQESKS